MKELEITVSDGYAPRGRNLHVRREWQGVTVEFFRFVGHQGYDFKLESPSNYVACHDMTLSDGEANFDIVGDVNRRDLTDTLSFLPAGIGSRGWAEMDGENSFTAVHFDCGPEGEQTALANVAPSIYFADAVAQNTILKLGMIARGDAPGSAIYVETLVQQLQMELGRSLRGVQAAGKAPANLAQAQLHRLLEYIEVRIAEDISLSDLAALAGLSRFHFLRIFKNTVGTTPHQYVLRRRLELAKTLLADGDLPIQAIAARAGFTSAVHFSRAFQQRVGVSAREYRKQVR
ncbi:MAG: helix-turn-helix transcriptional regulator [Xanthobacteraceae bacterium]|nr:helix-turn-helix transcriptional regulator [Xanthobacteraceae bacterium]